MATRHATKLLGDTTDINRGASFPYNRGGALTQEQVFNTSMISVRQGVEWQCGAIQSAFAFLAYKKNLKIVLQPIGIYVVGALLRNILSWFEPNQTSSCFEMAPQCTSVVPAFAVIGGRLMLLIC
ncbi:hypothetical protein V1522DRAFT_413819 [Lipomyces starkeyi]